MKGSTPQRKIALRADALLHPTRLDLAAVEREMLWPDDPIWRERALKSCSVEYALETPAIIDRAAPLELLQTAADALPIWAIHEEVKKERALRGLISGATLHKALLEIGRGNKNVTMKECAEFAIAPYKMTSSSGVARLSLSVFNNEIWPTYRPVAHYWAARVKANFVDRQISFPCELSRFREFLSDAEAYRSLGENKKTYRAAEPILRPGDAVLIPEELQVEPTRFLRFA